MKFNRLILLFILLPNCLIAQQFSEEYILPIRNIDHQGNVRSLEVKNYSYEPNYLGEVDTLPGYFQLFFRKDGSREKYIDLNKQKVSDRAVYYDSLNRVTFIEYPDKDPYSKIIYQYTTAGNTPAVEEIFDSAGQILEKTLVTFQENKPVRIDCYVQDTLRHYYTYAYNDNDSLVTKIFNNTPDGFGITLSRSFTGDEETKELWPNDTSVYEYSEKEDTLIRKRYDNRELKETHKYYKQDTLEYQETEGAVEKNIIIKTPTYIQERHVFSSDLFIFTFGKHADIYETININNPEYNKKEVQDIEIKEDPYGNWISKKYYREHQLIKKIEREITYYNAKSVP